MIRSRRLAALGLALALVACRGKSAVADAGRDEPEQLSLLTSLPLVFGEGFALDAAKHPLTARLEQDFEVRLVDGPEQLRPGGLLLAVQPQALTAERLVALDRWVREGGRMLLLADPRLTWEGTGPLGDKFRPPFTYPDTGLLGHWGLALSAGESGPALRRLGGGEVLTGSPGLLSAGSGRACRLSGDDLVARCALGRGQAVVVADADLVQVGVPGGLDGPTERNHNALAAELHALKR